MSKKVLVIGATGKTGRRLVPLLRSRDAAVRAASRTGRPGYMHFDWEKPETWEPAVQGIDAVYLIGPELVEDPSQGVAAFLDIAHKAGVKRVVALSSLGVTFPQEPSESGRLKAEAAVMRSDLEWTILRPSGFHQNFTEGFFAPGVQAGLVRTATASGKVAFVDANDIASVAAIGLMDKGHDGQVYALTGPHALSFAEAVDIIGQATGRAVGYSALSEEEFRSLMLGFGLPPSFADVVVRDQIAIRDGFATEFTDVVERVTGRPPVSFSEFAAEAFEPVV
jgi:uncharacterized protein YbjT (DUF2867 family)